MLGKTASIPGGLAPDRSLFHIPHLSGNGNTSQVTPCNATIYFVCRFKSLYHAEGVTLNQQP